jgi:hypothetical protein
MLERGRVGTQGVRVPEGRPCKVAAAMGANRNLQHPSKQRAVRSVRPWQVAAERKSCRKLRSLPGGYVPEHCDDFCRQVRGLEAHSQDHSHFCGRFCACLFWFSSGCLMPEAMADEAPVVRHITRITVRTVAPIRLVEFGAGLYVLMGIPVTPFTEHMGPMAEPDFGGPIPIPAGAIAECPRYHDQGLSYTDSITT